MHTARWGTAAEKGGGGPDREAFQRTRHSERPTSQHPAVRAIEPTRAEEAAVMAPSRVKDLADPSAEAEGGETRRGGVTEGYRSKSDTAVELSPTAGK